MTIFVEAILPIFIVGGLGYVVAKIFGGDFFLFSKVTTWIFASVFTFTFVNENVPKWEDISKLFVAFMILFSFNYVVFRIFGGRMKSAENFFLASVFGNTGYLGYPVLIRAFGEEALGYGVLYSVISVSVVNTLGIALLSRNFKDSVKNLLKLPFMYALVLALVLGYLGISWKGFPEPFYSSIDMLKRAGIPVITVFLGVSLSKIEWKFENIKIILISSLHRLLIVPALALVLAFALDFKGLFGRVFIVESAVPVAMNSVVIASELKKDPELMSSIVATSTLLSAITLTVWIYVSGVVG